MMTPHQPTTCTHCDTYVHHPPHVRACIPTQLCICCVFSLLHPVRAHHAPVGQRPLHDAVRSLVELQRPHCNSPQGLHRAPVPCNAPQRGLRQKLVRRTDFHIVQRSLWHPRLTRCLKGVGIPARWGGASCWLLRRVLLGFHHATEQQQNCKADSHPSLPASAYPSSWPVREPQPDAVCIIIHLTFT